MNKFSHMPMLIGVSLTLLIILFPDVAHASSTGMPWESPISKIYTSITGPVAFILSAIALAAAGFMLMWGGEISGWVKYLAYVCLSISIAVFASNIMSSVFGVSSTLI